ncbi:MAG: 50S ribosomal protein L29 [Patescibacteria group bacterium]|jgi:ribosomal protein L29
MKKTTEVSNLNSKDKKDLYKELKESQKKLTELRISQSFRKLKNYKEISNTRKKIARIWTILSEKILIEEISKVNKE